MLGFSVEGFNAFLANLGQAATWERASLCPARSLRTGGADVTCPVCGGTGYLWSAPQAVTVGITAMRSEREYAAPSEWEQGDVIATIGSDSPAYAAGPFDRFRLTQAALRFNHILVRGVNDTLKYRAPVSLIEVWAIVGGAKTVLTAGTDFNLVGNTIVWVSGTVAAGQQYSVTYTARPEYFVFRDLVQDRPHEGGLALPRKVQLRLMELLARAVA